MEDGSDGVNGTHGAYETCGTNRACGTHRAYAAYGILCTSSTSWLMNIAACSLNRSGDSDVK